jgi:hypothetical protein
MHAFRLPPTSRPSSRFAWSAAEGASPTAASHNRGEKARATRHRTDTHSTHEDPLTRSHPRAPLPRGVMELGLTRKTKRSRHEQDL